VWWGFGWWLEQRFGTLIGRVQSSTWTVSILLNVLLSKRELLLDVNLFQFQTGLIYRNGK
jgi:hypothetical protein